MNFEISHAVDDSDVAFVMRLDRKSTVCSMMSSRSTHYHKVGTNIDAFINLPTLNYLLAGLQLCYVPSHPSRSKWFDLLHDLDQERFPEPGVQLTLWDLRYIIRDLIVPFGIVRGSEKQGGQDETGLSPATWPVNFVCNLVLDGHDRNVVNYWHYHDVSAGDDLVFRLKPMPIPKGKSAYTLNHYYKHFVQQNFESYFQSKLGKTTASHVWQLVPDLFSLDCRPENDLRGGADAVRMAPGFEVPRDYVWQEQGYWHIARSQVMVRKYALNEYYNDDMANQLKVNHLDLTFEPAYCKAPGEERDPSSDRAVRRDARLHKIPSEEDKTTRRDGQGVFPGMFGAYRPWKPELSLEGAAWSAAPRPSQDSARLPALHELDAMMAPPPRRQPEPPRKRPLDMSIIFRDPPEMPDIPMADSASSMADAPDPGASDSLLGESFSLVFSQDDPAPAAASTGKKAAGKKRKPDQESA